MNEIFNPIHVQLAIQKYKYKYAVIPLSIVLIPFLLSTKSEASYLRYISVTGLICFLIVLFFFRLRKTIPEIREGEILAPMNGVIVKVTKSANQTVIILGKKWYHYSDIRTTTEEDSIDATQLTIKNHMAQWKITSVRTRLYENGTVGYKGRLIGIVPFNCSAELSIKGKFSLNVKEGDKVESGITVLAEIKEELKHEE